MQSNAGYTLGFATSGTSLINGGLRQVVQRSVINPPAAMMPLYQGNGAMAPTLPLPLGYGGTGINTAAAGAASANPFSPKHSPLPWLIGMLVVGILGLRYIHWRG